MDGDRLQIDPALETPPDFGADAFQMIRDLMVAAPGNNTDTHERAAEMLLEGWTRQHDLKLARWAAQGEADARREAEEERERLEREEADRDARQDELVRKRPKLRDFAPGHMVADRLTGRPSSFALGKLKSMEYVELYYFTTKGCLEAQRLQGSAENSFNILQEGGALSLRPVLNARTTKTPPDESLTWEELARAKTKFLSYLGLYNWPESHIEALTLFFVAIDNHDSLDLPFGRQALIAYQAQVRRDWHDDLDRDAEVIFDIAIINPVLLSNLRNDIAEFERDKAEAERNDAAIKVSNANRPHSTAH